MEQPPPYTADTVEGAIDAYAITVYRLAFSHMRNRADADDVFQEVFFRYVRKRPQFTSEEHRKAWFLRVTVNCCKKMYGSPWFKNTVALDDSIAFETQEENRLFCDLARLPAKYRDVIHLFYYEGLSVEEICAALRQKPSAVKMRLMRARKKLKDILKEDFDAEGNL